MSRLAVCIGCGCDDRHACHGGCSWLRVDYNEGKGVCSECAEHVAAWDRGCHSATKTPLTDSLIESVLKKHPGHSKQSQNVYYEAVHQELAPLARKLELELSKANTKLLESDSQAKDMAALIRRLGRALRKSSPENDLPDRAMEFLKTVGQPTNVLREYLSAKPAAKD